MVVKPNIKKIKLWCQLKVHLEGMNMWSANQMRNYKNYDKWN